MDDWNKPFTIEELVAIDAAFEAVAGSYSSKTSPTSSAGPRCQNPGFVPNSASFASRLCSTKWSFRQEQRMALHGRFKKQPPKRHVPSSTLRLQKKRPRVPIAVEEACMVRKWDEMDHDILVNIMSCLRAGKGSTVYNSFYVCKSWRLAVLDSVFPPGNVLDLRLLSGMITLQSCCYLFYLKILLRRPHQYTKLYFPKCFCKGVPTYVAQRLPKLKCVVQPTHAMHYTLERLIPYWPELNEAHCQAALIPILSKHCKNIKRLDLYGRIGDDRACRLASDFPQLMHLSIQSCILSPNALSIILQGCPDLTYLDTRHAFCIEGPIHSPIKGKVIEWDEDEASQKAVGVRTYLHCARRYCSYCAPLYSPNISRADLSRFDRM